jgi:HK97 family phage major capsid protein
VTSAISTGFAKGDLENIYFSVNRAYRVSPRAAWLMNDGIYQQVLGLQDTNGRPLINITEDGEKLFGKKILISPDMPTSAGSKAVLFGDFGQYAVRIARDTVQVRRSYESIGLAEQGIALYTAMMRVDATLITVGGDVNPVVYGTLHS